MTRDLQLAFGLLQIDAGKAVTPNNLVTPSGGAAGRFQPPGEFSVLT
ncbi:MAG: hypothetical protein OES25_03625 [Acidobacteriota bacterium]|nr:hypothetical protein [Acidobacteriota bacterium]